MHIGPYSVLYNLSLAILEGSRTRDRTGENIQNWVKNFENMNPLEYSQTQVVQPVATYPPYPQQPPLPGGNPMQEGSQACIINQPAHVGSANGCGQITYTCRPAPVVYSKYHAGQSKALGILQIIVGIVCIGSNAASVGILCSSYYGGISFVGHGIWSGVIFIITGSFGVAAAAKKSRCFVITFMVFCIISATLAAVVLGLTVISFIIDQDDPYSDYYKSQYEEYRTSSLAMDGLLLAMSVCEGVFSIWGSAICCKVACCGARTQQPYTIQPQPVVFQPSMTGNPQVIILTTANLPSQPGIAVYPVATTPLIPTAPGATLNNLSPPAYNYEPLNFVSNTQEK